MRGREVRGQPDALGWRQNLGGVSQPPDDPPRDKVGLLHLCLAQGLQPRAVDRRFQQQDMGTLVRGPELRVQGAKIGMDGLRDDFELRPLRGRAVGQDLREQFVDVCVDGSRIRDCRVGMQSVQGWSRRG